MQVWATCRYASAGITAYVSDLLTLRASVEFDTALRALHLRFVGVGITLWTDVYFKPDEFGIEDDETGFGWRA